MLREVGLHNTAPAMLILSMLSSSSSSGGGGMTSGPRLTELDLSDNHLGLLGGLMLTQAVQQARTEAMATRAGRLLPALRLNIDRCELKPDSCDAVMAAVAGRLERPRPFAAVRSRLEPPPLMPAAAEAAAVARQDSSAAAVAAKHQKGTVPEWGGYGVDYGTLLCGSD